MTEHQPSLFDPATPAVASAARHEAIQRADRSAADEWKNWARVAIRRAAVERVDFTADDVITTLAALNAPHTHNLSALGPLFLSASKRGEIVKTGERRLSVLTHRHRDLTIWRATDSLRAAAAADRAAIRANGRDTGYGAQPTHPVPEERG